MVDTITPVVHGGSRPRYALSILLHTLGATLAASAFGALLGGAGALVGAPWGDAGVVVVAAVALLYLLREAVRLPVPLPDRKRQVPAWWRSYFSPPVAALLYGFGLGVGVLTFLTFGTYVAVIAGAVASGDPRGGAVIAGAFGLARGLSLFAGARSLPEAVSDRLDDLGATPWPRAVNAVALATVVAAAILALA